MTLTAEDINYIRRCMQCAGPAWLRLQLRLVLEALELARKELAAAEDGGYIDRDPPPHDD
jgi:hypothetical protein